MEGHELSGPEIDLDPEGLMELAHRIRVHAVRLTNASGGSHVASSLSAAEILAVLYASVLRIGPETTTDPDRDRFVMSKGHAAAALYGVLSETGLLDPALLDGFYSDGGSLHGHVTTSAAPCIELSTGSLGHGLPVATGMALRLKRLGSPARVFCLLSDGECDEGSNWESFLYAPQHGLDNLVAIVDYNKIQSLGRVSDVAELEPLAEKFAAFRWHAVEVDGHDCRALHDVLAAVPLEADRPTAVVAHTVKGKGVSFMEDDLLWHYRSPQGGEFEAAMAELGEPS